MKRRPYCLAIDCFCLGAFFIGVLLAIQCMIAEGRIKAHQSVAIAGASPVMIRGKTFSAKSADAIELRIARRRGVTFALLLGVGIAAQNVFARFAKRRVQ